MRNGTALDHVVVLPPRGGANSLAFTIPGAVAWGSRSTLVIVTGSNSHPCSAVRIVFSSSRQLVLWL
jgi:hypothetical protein